MLARVVLITSLLDQIFYVILWLFQSFRPYSPKILPCLFPVIYFVLSPVIPNFCAHIFRLSSVIYLQSSHPHPHHLFPVIYKLAVNFTPNFFQSNPSHFQTHIIVYETLMKNDKYYGSLRLRDNRWGEV